MILNNMYFQIVVFENVIATKLTLIKCSCRPFCFMVADDDSTDMDEEPLQISNTELEDIHVLPNHLQPAEKSNPEYESGSSDLNPVTTDDQQDQTPLIHSTARSYAIQTTPLSTQTDQRCLPSHPWEADNGVSWTGGEGEGE